MSLAVIRHRPGQGLVVVVFAVAAALAALAGLASLLRGGRHVHPSAAGELPLPRLEKTR
jgi:hypothetical protein